jgi:hypothetical protein
MVDMVVSMINEDNGQYDNERDARRYKRLAVYISRHPPEKSWLIGLVASLIP